MSITFIKECNYLGEALSLMSVYYHKVSFTELQQELKKSSGYNTEADRILNIMQKVYDKIIVQVKIPEELSIYFDYFDETSRADGLATCMLYEGICEKDISIQKVSDYIKQRYHENRAFFITAVFNSDSEIEQMSDVQFMKELEHMPCEDHMKWNIWRIYQNFDEHVDVLMSVIQKIIPVIQKVFHEYEHEFISFYEYWQQAVEDDSFIAKLKQATKIEVQDDSEMRVCPSWMGCNSVRMFSAVKDFSDNILLLGLLFREKVFVDDANLTHDEICTRLKLLSDSSKYEIMKLIKKDSLYGSQLADKLSLSTATISHHVNGLANAGLINITKDSNRVYYMLNKVQVGFLLDQIRKDLYDD